MKRLFARLGGLKIAHKLIASMLLANLAILALVGALLSIYAGKSLHADLVDRLKAQTSMAAASGISGALRSLDKNAAREALLALATDKNMIAAAVYDRQGELFGVYPALTEGLKNTGRIMPQDYLFAGDELFLKQPLREDDAEVGLLVLQYSLHEVQRKFWCALLVIAGVLTGAIALAGVAALLLQRRIFAPLRALSEVTIKIAQQGDYSLRAPISGNDDIGTLARHVNDILAQLETRNALLEKYNMGLENLVDQRTEHLQQLNLNLEHRARHDLLTELPNRMLFTDRLQQAIFAADRQQSKVGVLFVDLDYFKQINDSYGHEAGDQVLIQAAIRMTDCVRNVDTVSRFAGDEFTLLLPNIKSADDLGLIAAKISEEFARPVIFNALSIDISASIGGAIYPGDAGDMEQLLQAADQAMYHAKQQGRNRFQLYSDSMNELLIKRQQLQSDLKRALANDEFVIFYQPVIDMASGRLDSFESLLRWSNPQLGMLTPDNFLAAAKESGLITEIDKLMFVKVCAQIKDWHRKGLAVKIRINLALRDLLSHDFIELFFELIEDRGINPAMLSVEIEENVLRSESPQIIRALKMLEESPVSIAIDNFGTEYASLVTLLRGRIQYVKIDRSYFQGNALHGERFRLIQALIVAMAHSLNVKVIAAGVETEAQREFLEKIGCDMAQGYLFNRPMLGEEAEKLLANAGLSA